jgi:serine/threonine-protein kinase RsbW
MTILEEKIPSRLDKIPEFISVFIEKIGSLGFDKDEIFDIRLCVEEALVNAIKHGNKLKPDLSVSVDVQLDKEGLTVNVRDEGSGFDYKKLPDPTKKENYSRPHGRGVFLIKNLMDRVEFLDNGRCIKMSKSFKKGGLK